MIGLSKYWVIYPIRAFCLSAALIYSRMQLIRSYDHLSLPSTSALSLLPRFLSHYPRFNALEPPIVRFITSSGNSRVNRLRACRLCLLLRQSAVGIDAPDSAESIPECGLQGLRRIPEVGDDKQCLEQTCLVLLTRCEVPKSERGYDLALGKLGINAVLARSTSSVDVSQNSSILARDFSELAAFTQSAGFENTVLSGFLRASILAVRCNLLVECPSTPVGA